MEYDHASYDEAKYYSHENQEVYNPADVVVSLLLMRVSEMRCTVGRSPCTAYGSWRTVGSGPTLMSTAYRYGLWRAGSISLSGDLRIHRRRDMRFSALALNGWAIIK